MTDPQSAQDVHLEYIRLRVDEILAQARLTNGRLRTAEDEIIRLQERSDANKTLGQGGLASGIISGLALAGWAIWDRLSKH